MTDGSVSRPVPKWLAAIFAIALLAVFGWLFDVGLMPSHGPHFKNLSVLDELFASRFIVGIGRLVMLAAAVYVFVSVFALIQRGQWLSSVGPFKTTMAVKEVTQDRQELEDELRRAKDTIDQLTSALREVSGGADG